MTECFSEPTLDEVLSDPLVQDVMASDGVDPAELQASLSEIAGDIRRRRLVPPAPAGGLTLSLPGFGEGGVGFGSGPRAKRARKSPTLPSPKTGRESTAVRPSCKRPHCGKMIAIPLNKGSRSAFAEAEAKWGGRTWPRRSPRSR